jgi:hypothetical protein
MRAHDPAGSEMHARVHAVHTSECHRSKMAILPFRDIGNSNEIGGGASFFDID